MSRNSLVLGIDASRANHEQKSGVEWYTWFIIQELKKIVSDSWQVVLYSDKPLEGALAELPVNWTQKVLNWPPRRLWTQIRLSTEMVQCPPDVLFIPAHVPPLIHPAKTVMTVHDVAALHFPESYSPFERWYSLASAKYAVKNLPLVIVPSQAVKTDLLALYQREENQNIKVIPHGFNSHFLNAVGPLQSEKYILSVGRLEEKKNTARLIMAFDKALQNGSQSNLVLVGKPGYGYEKVEEVIKNSPNKNKIKIIPWIAENELVHMMQSAEMFVFPSLYEGFGLPVLEAFASRVPVIVSSGGSLPEVAGDAALYIDPLNIDQLARTMVELSNDSVLSAELIQRGTQRVLQFSWEKTAKETWDFLNSLAKF